MSSFSVTPEHLDDLANHMGKIVLQIEALNLPQEDFGVWTGDPLVAELLHDFSVTMHNGVKEYIGSIDIVGGLLVQSANDYRRADVLDGDP